MHTRQGSNLRPVRCNAGPLYPTELRDLAEAWHLFACLGNYTDYPAFSQEQGQSRLAF